MTRREIAQANFREGYNCSQSVLKAFEDVLPVDHETLMKLGSSFGGGMGRLREVCGAVSAMFMLEGMWEGYATPETGEVKKAHYARIQRLAKEFEEKHGSILCRNLLNLPEGASEPEPEARTEAYYQSRPCLTLIGDVAEMLEKILREQGEETCGS